MDESQIMPVDLHFAMPVDLDFALFVLGAAWVAILVMLAAGGVLELCRLARARRRPAPFVAVLACHGLTLAQAERVAGFAAVHAAAASCRSCGVMEQCRRALRSGWYGAELPSCPNAGFFRRIAAEHFYLRWCKRG